MGFRQWVPRQERLGEFPHNIAQSHWLRERMSNGSVCCREQLPILWQLTQSQKEDWVRRTDVRNKESPVDYKPSPQFQQV